jgi:hypothetical protein
VFKRAGGKYRIWQFPFLSLFLNLNPHSSTIRPYAPQHAFPVNSSPSPKFMDTLTIPTDKEIFEGEIATYWFEDGILISLSKSPKRTVDLIRNNVQLVKRITGNRTVPLLIYLCDSPIPDKETRRFSTEQLPVIYKAMAMVSKPGLAKLIMNILFTLKPPPIPMKSFTNDGEAKKWLEQFRS